MEILGKRLLYGAGTKIKGEGPLLVFFLQLWCGAMETDVAHLWLLPDRDRRSGVKHARADVVGVKANTLGAAACVLGCLCSRHGQGGALFNVELRRCFQM